MYIYFLVIRFVVPRNICITENNGKLQGKFEEFNTLKYIKPEGVDDSSSAEEGIKDKILIMNLISLNYNFVFGLKNNLKKMITSRLFTDNVFFIK